jgi:hypothetical protein
MSYLWNSWPCPAVRNSSESCSKNRAVHGAKSHTPEPYVAAASDSWVVSLFKRGIRAVKNAIVPWPGGFEKAGCPYATLEAMSTHCLETFFRPTLKSVLKENGELCEQLITARHIMLFENGLPTASDRAITADSGLGCFCLLCLESDVEVTLRCHHRICFRCDANLSQLPTRVCVAGILLRRSKCEQAQDHMAVCVGVDASMVDGVTAAARAPAARPAPAAVVKVPVVKKSAAEKGAVPGPAVKKKAVVHEIVPPPPVKQAAAHKVAGKQAASKGPSKMPNKVPNKQKKGTVGEHAPPKPEAL